MVVVRGNELVKRHPEVGLVAQQVHNILGELLCPLYLILSSFFKRQRILHIRLPSIVFSSNLQGTAGVTEVSSVRLLLCEVRDTCVITYKTGTISINPVHYTYVNKIDRGLVLQAIQCYFYKITLQNIHTFFIYLIFSSKLPTEKSIKISTKFKRKST